MHSKSILIQQSKQHEFIRITFVVMYPNINQFTSISLLTKINSNKINSMKINSRYRHTKHTLNCPIYMCNTKTFPHKN